MTLIPEYPKYAPRVPATGATATSPTAGDPTATSATASGSRRGHWWKALLGGLGLWVLTVIVTILTRNANLVPTLILVGSFLVPFSATLLAIQKTTGRINPTRMLMAFFVGGIFGVLAASIFEAKVSGQLTSLLAAGFIEEAVKLAVLAFAARHIARRTPGLGAWLGVVVGAGFAAFESAGYALNSSLGSGGIDLPALLQTEALRGLLAPAGHILWTAIVGAALFAVLGRLDASRTAQAQSGRAPSTAPITVWFPLALTYLGVSVLHAAWDLAGNLAGYIAVAVTGAGRYQATYGFTPEAVVAEAQTLAGGLYLAGVIGVTVLGVVWLAVSVLQYEATQSRNRPRPVPMSSALIPE